MREIPLTQGFVAIVDDEDFDYLNQFKWCVAKRGRKQPIYYAARQHCFGNEKRWTSMHSLMMQPPKPLVVDHINHNGLDNRRLNLRVVSQRENLQNKRSSHHRQHKPHKPHKRRGVSKVSRCEYRGVSLFSKGKGQFRARITANGIHFYLGNFLTAQDAALAYDKKAIEIYGKNAALNFPEKFF